MSNHTQTQRQRFRPIRSKVLSSTPTHHGSLTPSTLWFWVNWYIIPKKRAIPRIQSEVPVSVSVLSATDDELVSAAPFDSKTHDISTAGLRFDTTLPLKKGDELALKLMLSPEQEITVNAKVMGTKKVKRSGEAVILVGTQFVEIQLDDQIKLLQFLIDAEESGKVASQDVPSQPEEPKTAPVGASKVSKAPPAAPETSAEVKSQGAQEPTQPKELSWFAAQMSKTEETEQSRGVRAAVPQQDSKPAEKPSMPIVRVSPSVQSGKAFLELSNGYHQPVTVMDVFAAKGAGSLTPLLTEPKQLSPGETQRLDVTEPLLPPVSTGERRGPGQTAPYSVHFGT